MVDTLQFMQQWHFSFYHDEEVVRHHIHRQRPFYSMTPMDEWDDGVREFVPFDRSGARPLNSRIQNPAYRTILKRKNKTIN